MLDTGFRFWLWLSLNPYAYATGLVKAKLVFSVNIVYVRTAIFFKIFFEMEGESIMASDIETGDWQAGWVVPPDQRLKDRKLRSGYRRKSAPARVVLHTAEIQPTNAAGLKRWYGNHSYPYHIAANIHAKGRPVIYQRRPLTIPAWSLKHPKGTPETNHMGAVCAQVCLEGYARNMDTLKAGELETIGALLAPVVRWIREWVDAEFLLAPYADVGTEGGSWGVRDDIKGTGQARMSEREWETGHTAAGKMWNFCGHQNVPCGNDHWDPGAIQFAKIAAVANELAVPPKPSTNPKPKAKVQPSNPNVEVTLQGLAAQLDRIETKIDKLAGG